MPAIAIGIIVGIAVLRIVAIGRRRRHRAEHIVHDGTEHAFDPVVVEKVGDRLGQRPIIGRGIGKQCRQQELDQPLALKLVEVVGQFRVEPDQVANIGEFAGGEDVGRQALAVQHFGMRQREIEPEPVDLEFEADRGGSIVIAGEGRA